MCVWLPACVRALLQAWVPACVSSKSGRERFRLLPAQCEHRDRAETSSQVCFGKSNQLAPFSRSAELPDAAPIQNCHKDIQRLPSLFFFFFNPVLITFWAHAPSQYTQWLSQLHTTPPPPPTTTFRRTAPRRQMSAAWVRYSITTAQQQHKSREPRMDKTLAFFSTRPHQLHPPNNSFPLHSDC